ncbi:hypothetical protein Arth_4212 (plasmid) [Arthrobacter sp. FB24]|uniref:hypothetical protein n=1 Tax=Arthrobacter sp. (strain FB24) TaxID=290399 RepID=UPI0000E5BEC4|nr:hypothetical protein Arth_4212 [Arthrobacter sp. FB24]
MTLGNEFAFKLGQEPEDKLPGGPSGIGWRRPSDEDLQTDPTPGQVMDDVDQVGLHRGTPMGWEQLTGDYTWPRPNQIKPGKYGPLPRPAIP